jgi:hypothetical protein
MGIILLDPDPYTYQLNVNINYQWVLAARVRVSAFPCASRNRLFKDSLTRKNGVNMGKTSGYGPGLYLQLHQNGRSDL